MKFDHNYKVPDMLQQVIRFDPTGSTATLGEMTGSGLRSLMDIWFDSAFMLVEPDNADATVCLPAHYLKVGSPLPERMTSAIRTHMYIWNLINSDDRPPENEYGGDYWTPDEDYDQ